MLDLSVALTQYCSLRSLHMAEGGENSTFVSPIHGIILCISRQPDKNDIYLRRTIQWTTKRTQNISSCTQRGFGIQISKFGCARTSKNLKYPRVPKARPWKNSEFLMMNFSMSLRERWPKNSPWTALKKYWFCCSLRFVASADFPLPGCSLLAFDDNILVGNGWPPPSIVRATYSVWLL